MAFRDHKRVRVEIDEHIDRKNGIAQPLIHVVDATTNQVIISSTGLDITEAMDNARSKLRDLGWRDVDIEATLLAGEDDNPKID